MAAEVLAIRSRGNLYRAVENRGGQVRPTRRGITLAADRQGRVLAYKNDEFVSENYTVFANVPTQGRQRVYVQIGDVLVYTSTAQLILVLYGAYPRRIKR